MSLTLDKSPEPGGYEWKILKLEWAEKQHLMIFGPMELEPTRKELGHKWNRNGRSSKSARRINEIDGK